MFDWDSSNISIKQFWDMLGHLHGVKRTQSRARFYELKKEGYVKSKSNGNETRVWLSYIPKEIQVKNTNFKPLEFWKKYIRCVGGYKALLTYLKELFVDDKTFEKERGVGSVGVVGAIIIKYIRRVEAQSKNKNKNILYELKNLRIGASADTPDTPNQINQNQANKSVNQENKGVDTPKNHPTHPEKTKQSKKKDKDIQFWEHPECEHIKPSCSKTDILQYIKQNSGVDSKKLYEKFGVGSLKFKNELLKEGRIKQNKLKLEVAKNE